MAAFLSIAVIGFLTYRSMQSREESAAEVNRVLAARHALNRLLLVVEEAQSGMRAYVITGDPQYLRGPDLAEASLASHGENLRQLLGHNPQSLAKVATLMSLARSRLDVIAKTIERKDAGDDAGALELIRSGRGSTVMEEMRALVDEMLQEEQRELDKDTTRWGQSVRWSSYITFGGGGILLLMLGLIAIFASRDFRSVESEAWVRRLQVDLVSQIQAELRLESLGRKVLDVLVPNLDAQVGAVYVAEPTGLRRIAGHALAPDANAYFERGQGLVGEAAAEGRVLHLADVPKGYLQVTSAVGRATPEQVVIVPASVDGTVQAVVELGFLREVDEIELSAMARLGDTIASAIRASRDRSRLEELLEETQRQAEELQAQQEELRAANAELEQQSRALQQSQAQLENQQSELEQVNVQLEEQAASLEQQRRELARAGAALRRESEYKSQFLANMSHELRTPLNSSLILAKLLAENREGNLTEEQVKFAKTIYSAGNDLLTLINDVLDLSKIEAGMLEVRAEPVLLERIVEDLRSKFAPIAEEKQLALEVVIDSGTPASFETDITRLQQILRNLLSNALKFTERGGVTLEISQRGEHLAFAVRDTGIGIAPDQHELIFEPFRQADGAANRKFGGTGLGLSISRDLARLLGGDLRVASALGQGSTFTLTVPMRAPSRMTGASTTMTAATPVPTPTPLHTLVPSPATVMPSPETSPRPEVPAAKPENASTPAAKVPQPAPFEDDRAKVGPSSRTLLIVEDDVAFARVLFDLAHELDFLAVVATTAEDGILLARQLSPSAIVLDIALPDHTGLAVLDTLKRDPSTRHVPVHVVSAYDYTRTALSMGAAGYVLKPVERERLVEAFKRLEDQFTRKLRRVLVVEDDPVLRESTARLLATDGVEIVTAGTTADALDQLASSTFDCMVLDLALPDRSGLELLEDMAREERYSFPPVIVYTGRSLSHEELRGLERFSHSIVIKGARSPERLLDEVTLFLHQVESKLPPDRQRMLRDARDREAAFEGKQILIVEDDVRNVFALSALLEPKGAKVSIARNGREALEHLNENPEVDLVLMDIMMPEMDGLEATRELRKDPRFANLPIIALTAKATADDRDLCIEAGTNDYISKPLDVDKLLSLARVWIRK